MRLDTCFDLGVVGVTRLCALKPAMTIHDTRPREASQVVKDWAIRTPIPVTTAGQIAQRLLYGHDLANLGRQCIRVGLHQVLDIGACTRTVAPQTQQRFDLFDREAERTCSADKAEAMHIGIGIDPIPSKRSAGGGNKADALVVSNHLGTDTALFRGFTDVVEALLTGISQFRTGLPPHAASSATCRMAPFPAARRLTIGSAKTA